MRNADAMLRAWTARGVPLAALALALALGRAAPSLASPLQYLPVGDPLEDEIRALDILGPADGHALRLPRTGMRPLQLFEIDSLPGPEDVSDIAHRLSLARIRRVLGRESDLASPGGAGGGSTPRLYQRRYGDGARFEISTGLEGSGTVAANRLRFNSGAGAHGRIALETDRWLAFTHLVAGYQDTARTYADPLFPKTNLIMYSDETYLGYTGRGGRWGMQFGRGRWQWGPGDEAGLLLSKASVAITALAFHARLEPLHADGTAIAATLKTAAGEQMAAHRLEWQPRDGLRIGVDEAARYKSAAWQPLYLMGVLPYIVVQRLQDQDEPEGRIANRNNVMAGADVAWRVVPGLRVYGEWLADDIHLIRRPEFPNKYAYQLGLEGVATLRDTRLVWDTEFTRVTRYVYTSAFGRDFVAQGVSLGYPFAPDAQRFRATARWDLTEAWQVTAGASDTKKGENTLDEPFVQGSPVPTTPFEGVVERTRAIDCGGRWWPSSGVDVNLSATYRWIDGAGHVAGARRREPGASFSLRLVR
ncbi:MAG: hypothetical protein HYR74_11520 [Candidatus Eisenbacteria bacterium]|nr:hypothetical protein [Candidatus Eisenbacteria bacterium]